jgi:hypothetical protein
MDSTRVSAVVGVVGDKLANLEQRAWEKANSLMEDSGEDASGETWGTWAWSRTSGALGKVRRVISREDAGPALPR